MPPDAHEMTPISTGDGERALDEARELRADRAKVQVAAARDALEVEGSRAGREPVQLAQRARVDILGGGARR